MTLIEKIESILEPSLAHQGYAIVRIHITGGLKKILQIMLEHNDGRGITIDECVEASRRISVLLAVDDPIPFSYMLEVSSPGIDRPLVKPKDFIRFIGHDAKIHVNEAICDQKRLVGCIQHANEDSVTLALFVEGQDMLQCDIPYNLIQKAKLFVDFEKSLSKKGKKRDTSKN